MCQRETPPVKIGGQVYCSVCGTALTSSDGNPPAAARRVSLDLSPRSRTNATRQTPPPATPNSPAAPSPAPAPSHPHGHNAAAVHQRAKPSQILDLRGAPAHPVERPAVTTAPNHVPAAPPASTHERHFAHVNARLEAAKQVGRSPHIQKFGGGRLAEPINHAEPPAASAHGPAHTHDSHSVNYAGLAQQAAPAHEHTRELPAQAATRHEAMTRLTPLPPAETPSPKSSSVNAWRPHLGLSPHAGRNTATIAAVAVITGYIWLQNYPKLALQSANTKAGISASLPAFMPSSYNLTRTDASPGLITLDFTSPSSSSPLTIAQHRTTWDSSSLLDNFVAKNTDDYATVQGQGLTIYLWGNDHATWVNHGLWYSIEGASRLSREQILKIAYSL